MESATQEIDMIFTHPFAQFLRVDLLFQEPVFDLWWKLLLIIHFVPVYGLASHSLLSVCVLSSIVWVMKLSLDEVTVLSL